MTVSTLAFVLALFGWVPLVVLLSVRLRRAEQASARCRQDLETLMDVVNGSIDVLAKVSAESHHNTHDAARTADGLTDLRGEYLAQARALDAHDERLQALEVR